MAQFFPAKGLFNKPHDKNGVYIDNGEVTFYKSSGKLNGTVKFALAEISSVTHVVKYQWWLMLVSYYAAAYAVTNAVTFYSKEMKELANIGIGRMPNQELQALLVSLSNANPNINFDPYVTEFMNTGKISILNNRYRKVAFKGCAYVFLALMVIMVAFFIIIAMTSK